MLLTRFAGRLNKEGGGLIDRTASRVEFDEELRYVITVHVPFWHMLPNVIETEDERFATMLV